MKFHLNQKVMVLIATAFLASTASASQLLNPDKNPRLQSAADVVKTELKNFSVPGEWSSAVRVFSMGNDEPQNNYDIYVAFHQDAGETLVFKLPDSAHAYKVGGVSKNGMLTITLTQVVPNQKNNGFKKIKSDATVSLFDLKDGYLTYYLE